MQFRPCIDIHNGAVKQIVGGSLQDLGDQARENFVSTQNADYYADIYQKANLRGGHVILLNSADSPYYEKTKEQALLALRTFPGGLQVGGGINPGNAKQFIDAGASHVIVTSYVFQGGEIRWDRIDEMVRSVGKEHLVLDLSCKKTECGYFVVTDRWQKMTKEQVTISLLEKLAQYCDEFLIHAVDVEGKAEGIEVELANMLSGYEGIDITYAGGVHSYEDVELLKRIGKGRIHVTIGSSLDLFGGKLSWEKVNELCK